MAGPLSSEEIEDVVSSVRRLVSNELGTRQMSRDLNAERLLLTPALRVVSEARPMAPLVLEAPLADPPAAAEAPESVETDELIDADAVELIEAEWEDEIWADAEVVSLGEVALAAEEAEVLMPPVDAAPVDGGDTHESWAEAGADWAEDEPVPFVPRRRRAESVIDAASVPEPVQPPPEEMPASEVGETDSRVDASPAESATRTTAAPQRMPTEVLDADGTPLAVLDEAALQEIVRLMIRDELQGDLGERITHSVRKLVRAEINRALVARDLD